MEMELEATVPIPDDGYETLSKRKAWKCSIS